jgi:hypothetical protein
MDDNIMDCKGAKNGKSSVVATEQRKLSTG